MQCTLKFVDPYRWTKLIKTKMDKLQNLLKVTMNPVTPLSAVDAFSRFYQMSSLVPSYRTLIPDGNESFFTKIMDLKVAFVRKLN